MSGMAGFSRMREVLRKRAAFFFVHGRGAPGVHFWTPVGLQTASPKRVGVCKSLRNLVGPPRFELGTSCTPSKRASQAAPRPESSIVRQTGAAGVARPSYNGPMRFGTAILALSLAMACAAACLADTLTLRNGQVVQGTYMGGTARTVKMQVDDTAKTYDVTDIATLQFTPPGPTASATLAPGHRRPGTTGAAAPKAPADVAKTKSPAM